VTFSIFAILASIATPGFVGFYRKTNLNHSAQILEATLYDAFFESWAKPRMFGVRGYHGQDFVHFFQCRYPTCTDETSIRNEVFLGGNKILSEDFQVLFSPPDGDIVQTVGAEDILEIEIGTHKKSKKLLIHKKSGLIE